MRISAPADREKVGVYSVRQTFLLKIQLHIQKRNYIRVVLSYLQLPTHICTHEH